jgi:hypothetical protein
VEYLEANFDWLVEGLDRLLVGSGQSEKGGGPAGYVIFDTPGQVELWTNHQSLRRIIERLTKLDYRVSQYCLALT